MHDLMHYVLSYSLTRVSILASEISVSFKDHAFMIKQIFDNEFV